MLCRIKVIIPVDCCFLEPIQIHTLKLREERMLISGEFLVVNLLVWLELELPCRELQHNFNINRKHKVIRLAQESRADLRGFTTTKRGKNGELDMSYCFPPLYVGYIGLSSF